MAGRRKGSGATGPAPAVALFAALAFSAIGAVAPLHAVTWTHDYTLWRVRGEDVDQVGANALRRALCEADYVEVSHVNAAPKSPSTPTTYYIAGETFAPSSCLLQAGDLALRFQEVAPALRAPQRLLPGDVVIIGDQISGIVGERAAIDHYRPPAAGSPPRREPAELRDSPDCFEGARAKTLEEIFAMPAPLQAQKVGRILFFFMPYVKERGWTVSHPHLAERAELWRKIPGVRGKDPAEYADSALVARDAGMKFRIFIEQAGADADPGADGSRSFQLAFRVEGEDLPPVFNAYVSGVVRGPKGMTKILPPRSALRLERASPSARSSCQARFAEPGPYSWYVKIEVDGCETARTKVDFEVGASAPVSAGKQAP